VIYKKLSYHGRTAQCAMLVKMCYVSRGVGVASISNSKSDLQAHWQWRHLKEKGGVGRGRKGR